MREGEKVYVCVCVCDSSLTARQSSRQVALIELGAATVIHNVHTRGFERAREKGRIGERESMLRAAVTDARGWKKRHTEG